MAPVKSVLIRLVSSAGTGYFYATRKCGASRLPHAPRPRARRTAGAPLTAHPPPPPPRRNPTNIPYKLAFMKYDPVVRQHVLFTEGKMAKGRGGRRAGKK